MTSYIKLPRLQNGTMGKKKRKQICNFGENETAEINERRESITKLIQRMTSKIEPKMLVKSRSDVKVLSSERISEMKRLLIYENNNATEKDRHCLGEKKLDTYEISAGTIDTAGKNLHICKGDSIDDIIDLIVSISIRRDKLLIKVAKTENLRKNELKSDENSISVKGRKENITLLERLENLEKRAAMFENEVENVNQWWNRSQLNGRKNFSEKSQFFVRKGEFEKNMELVLQENYLSEEPLRDLKTIERINRVEGVFKKNKNIVAPKADPIIQKAIVKLLRNENVKTENSKKVVFSETECCAPSSNTFDQTFIETYYRKKGWVSNEILRLANIHYLVTQAEQMPPNIFLVPDPNTFEAYSDNGGKTYCQNCKKKCSGEVLRVQDKYFHINCFKCKACKNSLAQGGFFCKDGAYYCTNDYQRQFGTKCSKCGEYVEGEVVTALGNTYHQRCFTCARCRQVFPSGERVTYTGKEVLCQKCVQIPIRDTKSPAKSPSGANECAGCGEELKDGQALIALEHQWHIWCFKCKTCNSVLHGEYMGKDGVPYCEKDYQKQFGVKCAYCSRFISGKVLQAGDNHHFHPTCARCTKCGDPFGDGEEMYLQGGAIWHPRCGPGPTENGTIVNGSTVLENGHCTDTDGEISGREGRDFDRMSNSAVSEMQFSLRSRTPSLNGSLGSPCNSLNRRYTYRTGSPGLILREYKSNQQYPEDISRIYTYSYLTEEPSHGYLKRPIDPYDKPPTSPHFHRPSSSHSQRSGKILIKTGSKSGMKVMAESIRSETPRPRSPHMNNEEPIELAHFPDAKKPKPGEKPKIERDDFPAPPYPYTDPERRKRWSDSYKGVSDDDEDETDAKERDTEDAKLKKEEEELSKIATGIGKVFLQNVKEREKLRQWKLQHLDPRNASRVPAANKEPANRLRYQSPVNASPSRNMDHPRPWEEDEFMDRSSSYRSSVGRSVGAIPSYNATTSSSRFGYVRQSGRSSNLPGGTYTSGYCSDYGVGYNGDFSYSGFGEKTHSTEFSSGKSDISGGSISEVDRRILNVDMPVSTTFQGLRYSSYSPHLRRSLPTLSNMNNEPPKIYPYHLLVITNYRLPADVDRCNLERHLSESEFEQKFQLSRAEFYRLPQWRRNDLKRRLKLF